MCRPRQGVRQEVEIAATGAMIEAAVKKRKGEKMLLTIRGSAGVVLW